MGHVFRSCAGSLRSAGSKCRQLSRLHSSSAPGACASRFGFPCLDGWSCVRNCIWDDRVWLGVRHLVCGAQKDANNSCSRGAAVRSRNRSFGGCRCFGRTRYDSSRRIFTCRGRGCGPSHLSGKRQNERRPAQFRRIGRTDDNFPLKRLPLHLSNELETSQIRA